MKRDLIDITDLSVEEIDDLIVYDLDQKLSRFHGIQDILTDGLLTDFL